MGIVDDILAKDPDAKAYDVNTGIEIEEETPEKTDEPENEIDDDEVEKADGPEDNETDDDKTDQPKGDKDGKAEPAKKKEGEKEDGPDPLSVINSSLGFDYEDLDQLRSDFEKVSSFESLSSDVKQKEDKIKQLEAQVQKLKDLYDPNKIFVSEAERKRQGLLRKFPDLDPAVITKVVNADLENMSARDAIILNELLDNGDIFRSETDVIEMFEAEHSIDLNDSFDELENVQKNKVRLLAKKALNRFKDLKAGAEETEEAPDILAERKQNEEKQAQLTEKRKEDWEKFLPNLAYKKELPDIKFKLKDNDDQEYEFVFELGKEFREKLKENAIATAELIARGGYDFNDENVKAVKEKLMSDFVDMMRPKIYQSIASTAVARYIEEKERKKANPKQAKDNEPVPETTDVKRQHDEADEQVLNFLRPSF